MAAMIRREWLLNPDVPVAGSLPQRLLAGRGLTEPADAAAFLQPSLGQLHDPFLLKDMDRACTIIQAVLAAGEPLVIHGDYDVDGITATALLARFFTHLKARCTTMIPDRLTDGYGLASSGADSLAAGSCRLLITVDCGISSFDEVARLKKAGLAVIITDHHTCKEQLPAADAVINPKRPDSGYPFDGLAGVGVALKLMQALCIRMNLGSLWQANLDLVALGTVADVVPLLDENRILTAAGLEQINQQKRTCGLDLLLQAICQPDRPIGAQTLGYTVAPRINASGRLGNADDALNLLLTDDPALAGQYARQLIDLNKQRQDIELAVTQEAMQDIDSHFDFSSPDFILAANPGWHPGVIGIVASRLAEHYCRPVIVLTGDEEGYRGSCRSWGDLDILAALQSASGCLIRYGGHRKAAGLTLAADQLDHFRLAIQRYAASQGSRFMMPPSLTADLEVSGDELTLDHALAIRQMEPFGEGNPVPQLISRSLMLKEMRPVGGGRHLKLSVLDPRNHASFDGIAFGLGEADDWLKAGDSVDLLFALEINEWQGKKSVQLNIRDIHPCDTGRTFFDQPWEAERLYQQNGSIQDLMHHYDLPLDALVPENQEYKVVYQYLHAQYKNQVVLTDLSVLAVKISRNYHLELHPFRLARILSVFQETGLLNSQALGAGRIRLALLPVAVRVHLDDSPTYQRLLQEREGGKPQ
ncbi:MAG: single-stranded-DNA-specific exonuclease RecJ [Clostridiaceae bacterium]|nr:single-stranded-DNA-specific exonuclease RecJ [Clostridiaceae bacterium]